MSRSSGGSRSPRTAGRPSPRVLLAQTIENLVEPRQLFRLALWQSEPLSARAGQILGHGVRVHRVDVQIQTPLDRLTGVVLLQALEVLTRCGVGTPRTNHPSWPA